MGLSSNKKREALRFSFFLCRDVFNRIYMTGVHVFFFTILYVRFKFIRQVV